MCPQPRSIPAERRAVVPAWTRAALLLCALLVAAGAAQAQPGLRYRVNQRGDFAVIGNVLGHACRPATSTSAMPPVPAPVVGTVRDCGGLGSTGTANDVFWQTDGVTARASQGVLVSEASSQAMLQLPAGAQVTYARLYWVVSGDTQALAPQVTLSRLTLDGFSEELTADATWASTSPTGQPASQGSVEVTRIVGRYGPGAYLLSGVEVGAPGLHYGGTGFAAWWMVVFYRLPTEPVRTLALYDDLRALAMPGASTRLSLGGFLVPARAVDAKLGVVVYQGDMGEDGETFALNGQPLADASNPSHNFFNGTRSHLGTAVSRVGDLPQLLGTPDSVTGLDLDVVDVSRYFRFNETSAVAQVKTGSDSFWLAGLPVSVTTLAPDFTNTVKTFRPVSPRADGSILGGDTLEYTISTINEGNEASRNTVLTDTLPAGLEYVPGSLAMASGLNTGALTDGAGDDQGEYVAATRTLTVRLGTGANATQGGSLAVGEKASVTFRVRIAPGFVGTLRSQAYIRARGVANPTESTTPSTPTSGGTTGPTATLVAPPAPVVLWPPRNGELPTPRPIFHGTSQPGLTVEVSISSILQCRAIVDADGTWFCQSDSALTNGSHTLLAVARDEAGVSPAFRVDFRISTGRPTTPVITEPAEGSSTNNKQPPITGVADPGVTITVCNSGDDDCRERGIGAICVVGVASSGAWTCTPSADLPDGLNQITAVARDTAGNTSPITLARTFTVDTVPPAAPVIATPAPDSRTNNPLVPITGTAEANSTVTVTEDGVPVCSATADSDGRWTCTPDPALAEGRHEIIARAADAAGNVSPVTPIRVFFVDTVPPAAPVIATPTEGSSTNERDVQITGTAELDSRVTVTEGGITVCTASVSPTGTWACTPPPTLAEGPHEIVAAATDEAGNTGPITAVRRFTVDTVAPLAPVIVAPSEGSTTNALPLIAGTAEPYSTVVVTEGEVRVCTDRANGDGAWDCVPEFALAHGEHQIVAKATDAAGNTSQGSPRRTFLVDAMPPLAPSITAPTEGRSINTRRPNISGTAETGATVTVRDSSGGTLCTVTAADGIWGCTPTADLPEGLNQITAIARDAVGNTGPASAVRSFTVDVSAPAAPLIRAPAEGSSTSNRRPGISGTAEANAVVTVRNSSGGTICTATADAAGGWNCTPDSDLPLGLNQITALATDAAGNVSSPSTVRSFTVDIVAPLAPVIATPAEGSTTNNRRVLITGTTEARANVIVSHNGGAEICRGTADSSGNWICRPTDDLPERVNQIIAVSRDAADNTSPASAVRSFTVDITPPATPEINAPTEGLHISNRRPSISGRAEANSAVTVTERGITVCTAQVDASGNWTCTPLADLSEGAHEIIATATDAARNTSPTTPVRTFVVDTVAPAAPGIVTPTEGSSTNSRRPAISGTAEAMANIVVRDRNGDELCPATADASGNWSCTPGPELSEGENQITARATDAAGNMSPVSPVRIFFVNTTTPPAPVIVTPAEESYTSNTRPTISGTAERGSTVTVTEAGITVCSGRADSSTGAWSCDPLRAFSEGQHELIARATNAAGNTGPATPVRTFFVDTTPPLAPEIAAPAQGSSTNSLRPSISGTAEPNATVIVRNSGNFILCTATANASRQWSCPPGVNLPVGENRITAVARDAAGNTGSASPVRSFIVDITPPGAPVIAIPAEGSSTNNLRPPVSGTAEADATVTIRNSGGTSLCADIVRVDASGNWSCRLGVDLPVGRNQITAVATDAAGNTGPASPVRSFTVDTTAPAAPVITAPAAGSSTNNNLPSIAGTAEPLSTVIVTEGSVEVCRVPRVNADGRWSCTPGAALSEGVHRITAVARDAANNTGPATPVRTFSVDTVAPAAPVITVPAEGSLVNNARPEISGTAEANASVTVSNGRIICTAWADVNGNWSCRPTSALPEGQNRITAVATDAASNTSSASPVRAFTVDTNAPAAPTINTPTEASTVTDNRPSITGTAEPGSRVTVIEGTREVCTATTTAGGVWQCTPTAALSEGWHTIVASATDAAGNRSLPSPGRTFFVDAVPPGVPVIISPADSSSTNDRRVEISGIVEGVELPATVTVRYSGTTNVICTATVGAGGTWSCRPTADLPERLIEITATVREGSGTESQPSPVHRFTVDVTAPDAPGIASPLEGGRTNNARIEFSGTAEAGATVIVRHNDGTEICRASASASGSWSCVPMAALPEGVNRITAVATDAAGNISTPAARSFTVDLSAPVAPEITAPAAGSTVTTNTPSIEGTAEPGSRVSVTEGTSLICEAGVGADGRWTCRPGNPLSEGRHEIVAKATDAAGNTGPASPVRTFFVDSVAPAAPVIETPSEGSHTNDPRVQLTGTAEAGATVIVRNNSGTEICRGEADTNGRWNCQPTANLPEGENRITAVAVDASGNTSPPTRERTFIVDTRAPQAPEITAPPEGSYITTTTRPALTGTAEANSTVTVSEGGRTVCTTTASASGNWTCTPGAALAEGRHEIVATATDTAGNTSPASPVRTFTVDTLAPAAPVLETPAESSTTSNPRVAISGTAEANATVNVRHSGGGVICTARADVNGNWSCTPTADLLEGVNRISATATDAAGNTSSASTVRTFTVDSSAPAAPVITTPAASSITNNRRPPVAGTAEANATVTVRHDNGSTICTTNADESGNWRCTPTADLPEGVNRIIAVATDELGNTSSTTPVRSFTVDTTPPAAPVIATPAEGALVEDNTPDFTGTAEPGSTVSVSVDGTPACSAVAAAGGDWSCAPTTPLSEGAHQAMATATDMAGNESPATPVRNFTVDTTAPAAPAINTPAEGSSTSNSMPAITGTAEPRSTVTVTEGEATLCTTVTDASGNWSCTPTAPLAVGPHAIVATAVDERTNARQSTPVRNFTILADNDSDDDGIPDDREPPGDTDGDGTPDMRDPDSDNDGIQDGEEDRDLDGAVGPGETNPRDADTDMGGAKDGEEVNGGTNPLDGTDDYHYIGLGCTSAGATPLLLPLALLLALPRRRRQASARSPRSALTGGLLLTLLAVLAAPPARAQGIDLQQYKPGPGINDVLGVYSPKVGPNFGLHGGLSLNYGRDPLSVLDPRAGTIIRRIVTDQFTADLLASVSLFDRFELGLALPITLQGGPPADDTNAFLGDAGPGAGLGDLRLVPKALLLSMDNGLDVGFALPLSLPTGGGQGFLGASGVSVTPMVTAQWTRGGLRALANLGVRLQPETQQRNLRVGHELAYALGAEVPLSEPLSVRASLEGALGLNMTSGPQAPLELLAAARYMLREGLALQVGGGPGLTRGYGTPAFRLFASVGWTPPALFSAPRATGGQAP